MSNAAKSGAVNALERVLIGGDLKELSAEERLSYYSKVCESVGLNPLTKPFEYITLNGKLTLYARKDATDQLRSVHGISVIDMQESEREGVFVVTVKVQNAQGRTDMAKGAVNIGGLRGEALANALMKAETKAKRRATLSLCGLGMLDETEVADIPDSAKAPADAAANRMVAKHTAVSAPQVPALVAPALPDVVEGQPVATADHDVEAKSGQAARPRNSSGTAYPVPPEEVIAMLRQRRPLKWLVWTEGLIDTGEIWDAAAFTRDFKAAVAMLANAGGPQWKRWEAVASALKVDAHNPEGSA